MLALWCHRCGVARCRGHQEQLELGIIVFVVHQEASSIKRLGVVVSTVVDARAGVAGLVIVVLTRMMTTLGLVVGVTVVAETGGGGTSCDNRGEGRPIVVFHAGVVAAVFFIDTGVRHGRRWVWSWAMLPIVVVDAANECQ